MKGKILLVTLALILSASVAFCQSEYDGNATSNVGGYEPPPTTQPDEPVEGPIVMNYDPPSNQEVAPPPSYTPAPRYQTREGVEESAKRVLRGDFALKNHLHPAPKSTSKSSSGSVSRRPAPAPKPAPAPAQKPASVVTDSYNTINNNFAPPPADRPAERRTPVSPWLPIGIIGLILAGACALVAIVMANTRQIEENKTARTEAQANLVQAGLDNQAGFQPGAGRSVKIRGSIFPNGGGTFSAESNDLPATPAPAATPAPVVVTTPPAVAAAQMNPAAILTLEGLREIGTLHIQNPPPAPPA